MVNLRPAIRSAKARTDATNPFMSAVPRPKARPSCTAIRNGSKDQSCPSTGTTSVWPESRNPGRSGGPIVANKFALRPISVGKISASMPRSARKPRMNSISSRLGSRLIVGKAISRSRSSSVFMRQHSKSHSGEAGIRPRLKASRRSKPADTRDTATAPPAQRRRSTRSPSARAAPACRT